MEQQIVSINVGRPTPLAHQSKEVMSAIRKKPVQDRIYLSKLNFDGDEQADLKHHGGVDKAVCVYSYTHYPFWVREFGLTFEAGAFGENLTVEGCMETDLFIGDIFQLGEATVQISQPRQPCFKLAALHGIPELAQRVQDTGYTGFYFRVLTEGYVSAESMLCRVEQDRAQVSLHFANQIMHHDKQNRAGLTRLLAHPALSESWRVTLMKRL